MDIHTITSLKIDVLSRVLWARVLVLDKEAQGAKAVPVIPLHIKITGNDFTSFMYEVTNIMQHRSADFTVSVRYTLPRFKNVEQYVEKD